MSAEGKKSWATSGVGTEDFEIGPDDDDPEIIHRLWEAVDGVPDLHIPVSVVEMAMVYDIHVDGGDVTVEMTYPCMGCPAYDMIQDDVKDSLLEVEEVERIEIVWDPVWSKDMLTEEARKKIQQSGIGI
ncbi:MAG: iron-sulfur cluster assembly protein [Halobacteria archaeon]|nr:iron-sulfur cluster assembly protein [Halobacteria archaeon]